MTLFLFSIRLLAYEIVYLEWIIFMIFVNNFEYVNTILHLSCKGRNTTKHSDKIIAVFVVKYKKY